MFFEISSFVFGTTFVLCENILPGCLFDAWEALSHRFTPDVTLIFRGMSLVVLFPGRHGGKRELLKRLLPHFNFFAIFLINDRATWWWQIPKATIYIKRDWVSLQLLAAPSPWRYPVPWLSLFPRPSVLHGHTVSQSNYRSIKGFLQPSAAPAQEA